MKTPEVRYSQAVGLIEDGRSEEAVVLLNDVVRNTCEEPNLRLTCAKALLQRGLVFEALGDEGKSFDDYDALVSLARAPEAAVREVVAWALNRKGLRLRELGRPQEALQAFAELDRLFADDEALEVKRLVSATLVSIANVREELGRDDGVIQVANALTERYVAESDAKIRLNIARAYTAKAVALHRLRRAEEAVSAYDELLAHLASWPVAEEPELREQMAWALANRASFLIELARHTEALSTAEEAQTRFAGVDDVSLFPAVATAVINRARALDVLDRKHEELAAYDEVINRYASIDRPELQALVSTASANRASVLLDLGRADDAIQAYADVVSRYGDLEERAFRQNVARALYFEAAALADIGRREDAMRIYEDLIARFAGAHDDVVAGTVMSARERRAALTVEWN